MGKLINSGLCFAKRGDFITKRKMITLKLSFEEGWQNPTLIALNN